MLIAPALFGADVEPPVCAALPAETELESRWSEIDAVWREHLVEGVFDSPSQPEPRDGYRVNRDIRIAYAVLARPANLPSHGNIVVANGRTEGYLKYREMAVTLWCQGYSVYMIDHRGQGLSSRVLVHDVGGERLRSGETAVQYANRGHVENFAYYVRDLEHFVDQVVPGERPRILLAHSMGGAIGLRLIQQRPDLFDAAVMSSPMFGVPGQFACGGAAALAERSGADAYIPGGGPWIHEDRYPYRDDWGFTLTVGWHYTGSEVRHNIWHREFAEPRTAADGREQDLRIGAPTLGWFTQSCAAVDSLQSQVNSVTVPLLLLIAEDDTVIPEGRQRDVCDAMNQGRGNPVCRAVLIEDARHEMFIETDAVRDGLLREMFTFLGSRAAQP